jgi:chromate reductase
VADLAAAIEAADAVLFATPEYNAGVPGQLKNAVDWLSRPLRTNPLRGRPVAVVGASTGMLGAVGGQADLRKALARLGARVLDVGVAVPHAREQFDETGHLRSDEIRAQLGDVLTALHDEARSRLGEPVAA